MLNSRERESEEVWGRWNIRFDIRTERALKFLLLPFWPTLTTPNWIYSDAWQQCWRQWSDCRPGEGAGLFVCRLKQSHASQLACGLAIHKHFSHFGIFAGFAASFVFCSAFCTFRFLSRFGHLFFCTWDSCQKTAVGNLLTGNSCGISWTTFTWSSSHLSPPWGHPQSHVIL